MAYDIARDVAVLFGGYQWTGSQTIIPNDVSEWDGNTWQIVLPSLQPGAEFLPAMCSDPVAGVLLYSNVQPEGLWRWDGLSWVPLLNSSIGTRLVAAMALDPVRNRVVLFGGTDSVLDFDETWEWDGVTWTQVVTAMRPPGRAAHAMAFDPSLGELVMAGGVTGFYSGANGLTDTWAYNGTRWLQLASAGGYAAPALVHDDRRGRLVQVQQGNAVREWIHGSWVDRSPTTPVPACSGLHSPYRAVAYHRASGGIVALMPCWPSTAAETWTYGPTMPALVDRYGGGCLGSAGIPDLRAAGGSSNLPWLGSTFRMQVDSSLPAPQAALIVLGLSRTFWGGVALPLPLAAIGMPGCSLLAALDATGFSVQAVPAWDLALPSSTALLGARVFAQAALIDPPANAAGLVVSNALALTIGGR